MKTATKTTRRAPNGVVSNKPIALRLEPSELDRVKKLAAREQRSLASVARLLTLRSLADCERNKKPLAA